MSFLTLEGLHKRSSVIVIITKFYKMPNAYSFMIWTKWSIWLCWSGHL